MQSESPTYYINMSRNQINQPLIIPHPGLVVPSSGLTVFPYQNPAGLVPALSLISPQTLLSSPIPASPNSDGLIRYSANSLALQSPTSPSSTLSSNGKDFRIITWEELKKIFPSHGPDGRVESGLLSDGRAYAQKTARKENYFLFPSKSAYILYFIHYYFSYENLDRDQTFRRMMIESTAVSVEKLIQAPRLASIGTTPLDLQIAISNSNILCLVDLPDGDRGVKRIDGYPGSFPSSDAVNTTNSEVKHETSAGINSLTDKSPPPAHNHSNFAPERKFVSSGISELPSPFNLTDSLISNDSVSCNNSSEFDNPSLSFPFAGSPFTISSSSQKNPLHVSPANYTSSIAREPSPVVVSAFPNSPTIPFSVHSSMQSPGLLLPYSSAYSIPLQSPSCAFPQQVSPGNFVGRAPISFDTALNAFLTLSGGNGSAFAHHMTGSGAIQSPSNVHFYCHQLSNGSNANHNPQLHAYRSLFAASQSPTNPALSSHAGQNAAVQPDVFSTLANFTQYYQQQHSMPRTAGPFQPGQQFYPHPIHLHPQHTGRRNTPPPPNQQAYYQLAGNQSMPACTPQNSQPQFYSALPVSYSPGFPFSTPGSDGGFSAFKGQLPPSSFLQDSAIPNVWNSSEALLAATAGINLQYTAPQQLSALVSGLPLAFDNLSLNCGRTPAIWHQSPNSSVMPASIKTVSVNSQCPTTQLPATVLIPTSSPLEMVHPCAVDDPSIVAVTDSGDNAQITSSSLVIQERDGPASKISYSHSSKNGKGKQNWQSKFPQSHNVSLINNIPSSPVPFFPTTPKGRPQSALDLPALDLIDESILKYKEILPINDLGISLHSNPD